jgi:polyhydroxyalkanoate synthase subunit PhaE
MTEAPWEDFARRWRELYEQQAELTRNMLGGQTKIADAITGAWPGGGQDAAAMAELWRSWMTLGSAMGSVLPKAGESGGIAGATLGRLLDPVSLALAGGSQIGETIRKLTEGPRFADFGALERRVGKVTELWLEVQQRARAFEAVVVGAWSEAGRRFMAALEERHSAGSAQVAPKEALRLWLDVVNRTLLETQRSAPFLEAQGELLRRCMDFLLAERELVESLVEPAGLPTRSEIDEVHRSVQDLKRRVRSLEKAGEAGSPQAASQRKPAPAKPSRRRRGDTR